MKDRFSKWIVGLFLAATVMSISMSAQACNSCCIFNFCSGFSCSYNTFPAYPKFNYYRLYPCGCGCNHYVRSRYECCSCY